VEKLRKVPAAAKKVSIDSDSADMQGNFCFFPMERGGEGQTLCRAKGRSSGHGKYLNEPKRTKGSAAKVKQIQRKHVERIKHV